MSNYRDDREAQRARTAAVEVELAAKNRELDELKGAEHARQRLDQLERDLAAAQAAVAALTQQTTPTRKSRSWRPVLIGVLGAVVLWGAAMVLLRRMYTAPAPVPAPTAPPRPIEVAAAASSPPPPPVSPASEPVPSAAPPSGPTPTAGRRVTARWRGNLSGVRGVAVARACAVEAELVAKGTEVEPRRVVLSCGKKKLYDSNDPLNGLSELAFAVREVPGDAPGRVRFSLLWNDAGERSPTRNQASINSSARSAAAWKTTLPPFRVDVTLEQRSTEDVETLLPSGASNATCRELTMQGTVAEVSGKAPSSIGQACKVALGPNLANRCRVNVSCADVGLFGHDPPGERAYVDVIDGKELSDAAGMSVDGDPMLSWPIGSDTLVVSDEKPPAYGVQIRITAPPRDVLAPR